MKCKASCSAGRCRARSSKADTWPRLPAGWPHRPTWACRSNDDDSVSIALIVSKSFSGHSLRERMLIPCVEVRDDVARHPARPAVDLGVRKDQQQGSAVGLAGQIEADDPARAGRRRPGLAGEPAIAMKAPVGPCVVAARRRREGHKRSSPPLRPGRCLSPRSAANEPA